MSLVESIASLIRKKPSDLTLSDIQESLPNVRRRMIEYEHTALDHERKALDLREKAFTPGGSPADQAALLRQSKAETMLAETVCKQAGVFVQHMSNLRALETTMQIVEEFKSIGFLPKNTTVKDWQKVMDEMTVEIENMVGAMQKMQDVIADVLPTTLPEASVSSDQKELEALFERYNKTTDPAEKETIRREIEKKAALA